MGPGEEFQAPPTTRLGPPPGSDRRARVAVGLAVVALALAVAKPWELLPGSTGAASPGDGPPGSGGSPPVAATTLRPTPWTGLGEELACLSGRLWLLVVDEVDEGRPARSWTRLAPVPARGPDDPAVVGTHTYATSVRRVGFCAPVATALAAGADPGASFAVRLWQVDPAEIPGEPREVPLVAVAGGTLADGGALYAAAPGPAGGERRSWPPGRYVFEVQVPGAGPGGDAAAWFAIELRGPWTGPAASPSASPAASPSASPAASPGGSPGPSASPSASPAASPGGSPGPAGYSRRSP
jgi:hypothetical protein